MDRNRKTDFTNMSDVLAARNVEIETRKRLARCYVLSTLLYASETWTLNADQCKKVNSFEMLMHWKDRLYFLIACIKLVKRHYFLNNLQ